MKKISLAIIQTIFYCVVINVLAVFLVCKDTLLAAPESDKNAPASSPTSEIPTPAPSIEAFENSKEEEVVLPLDAWIIKKKVASTPVAIASPKLAVSRPGEGRAAELILDEDEELDEVQAQLAEEKKEYDALLEEYEGKESIRKVVKESSANRILTKSVLSKEEQRRIDRILKTQRKFIAEQKRVYQHLLQGRKVRPLTKRLCLAAFPVMGMPSDVKNFSEASSKIITSSWRMVLKEIIMSECSLVVMTGLVSKTKSKRVDFIDKTASFLSKVSNEAWNYRISQSEGVGFFSVLYLPSQLELMDFQELAGISLRRGGDFVEQSPFSFPMELLFHDLKAQKRKLIRVLAFDLRDFNKISRTPSTPYLMQAASALNEVSNDRIKKHSKDSFYLMGYMGAPKVNPVWPILSGQVKLSDFLPERTCRLIPEVERESGEEYHCKDDVPFRQPKQLFGAISDFFNPNVYATGRELRKLRLAKSSLQADIFSKADEFAKSVGWNRVPLAAAGRAASLKDEYVLLYDFKALELKEHRTDFVMFEVLTEEDKY